MHAAVIDEATLSTQEVGFSLKTDSGLPAPRHTRAERHVAGFRAPSRDNGPRSGGRPCMVAAQDASLNGVGCRADQESTCGLQIHWTGVLRSPHVALAPGR